MNAAILVEQNMPLIIDEVELPEKLKIGQVLVKIHFSGICGSQIGEIDGAKGPDKFLPHLLGHEASGTVLQVGPGVKYVKKDDVVVMHWRRSRGIESPPPVYRWNGEVVNAGWITTFNEYAVVSENRLTAIPSNSNLEIAALFGCAVTTGFGVVTNNAKIKIGESVVVFGAGGVGLNIVQAANLAGGYPIIAVDVFDNRLELARLLGATHIVNSKKSQASPEIDKVLAHRKLDHFIDNTGLPEIIELGYEKIGENGKVTLVGVPKMGSKVKINTLQLHFGKSISGSHGGEAIPHLDIPRYFELFNAGRIDLNNIITSKIPLCDINQAIYNIKNGNQSGRCLIEL